MNRVQMFWMTFFFRVSVWGSCHSSLLHFRARICNLWHVDQVGAKELKSLMRTGFGAFWTSVRISTFHSTSEVLFFTCCLHNSCSIPPRNHKRQQKHRSQKHQNPNRTSSPGAQRTRATKATKAKKTGNKTKSKT